MFELIRDSLPKYDPEAHKAPLAPAPHSMNVRRRGVVRAQPSKAEAVAPREVSSATNKPIMLPRFMVRPTDGPPQKVGPPLPRMTIQPPVKDEPAEAFETPAARDERLVRKHLSAFDRFFLNRVTPFGVSMVQRAQQAEAIEHSGMELNAIAELVEGNESDKGKTEENRRLREAYYDTYIARPK